MKTLEDVVIRDVLTCVLLLPLHINGCGKLGFTKQVRSTPPRYFTQRGIALGMYALIAQTIKLICTKWHGLSQVEVQVSFSILYYAQ